MGGPDRVERSPADVLRLVVAAVALIILLLAEWLFGDTLVAFTSDLLRGLDALPDWIVDVVLLGTRILAIALLGGGLLWSLYRRHWRMVLTGAAAGGIAALLVVLFEGLTPDDAGQAPVDLHVDLPVISHDGFPSAVGLGAAIAVLTAVAPWVSRRVRRWSWALIVGLIITRTIATPVSFDSSRAALIGWTCGALTLVLLGAPSRRPTMDAVVAGLRSVGLPVRELQVAGVDARGSTPYFGVTDDGQRLFVKALGDDERSADLLFRLYRRVEPRDFGDEKPFSTLRRGVEHEALVALAAAGLGVRTPRLRSFATAEPNGYVLAYEAIEGRSLDRLEPSELTDGILGSIWEALAHLREHRIAHRDLRLANIFLDDGGQVWIIDFGFSELAASELLLANDVAELLASSSVYVGAERATAPAAATVDEATLTRALDRLRPWALSGATRTALKASPPLLPELTARLTERLSTP